MVINKNGHKGKQLYIIQREIEFILGYKDENPAMTLMGMHKNNNASSDCCY